MALTEREFHSDKDWCLLRGTADADTDASQVYQLSHPMRSFTVQGSRPDSGNFSFTFQGSIDGSTFTTLATSSASSGTNDTDFVVDKPILYFKVVFTDVNTATVTFSVVGVK